MKIMKISKTIITCTVTFILGLSISTALASSKNNEDEVNTTATNILTTAESKSNSIVTDELLNTESDFKNEFENENNSQNIKTDIADNNLEVIITKPDEIDSLTKPAEIDNLTNSDDIQPKKVITEVDVVTTEKKPELSNTNKSNIINDKSLITIGKYTIMDDSQLIKNEYDQYFLKSSSNESTLFFNGGTGQYGNFMLSIKLQNQKYINSISYSQWDESSPITMNLGNIKIGDNKDILLSIYGQWDNEEVNYDVKQLIYKNLTYNGMSLQLIVFADSRTNLIYGYKVFINE